MHIHTHMFTNNISHTTSCYMFLMLLLPVQKLQHLLLSSHRLTQWQSKESPSMYHAKPSMSKGFIHSAMGTKKSIVLGMAKTVAKTSNHM